MEDEISTTPITEPVTEPETDVMGRITKIAARMLKNSSGSTAELRTLEAEMINIVSAYVLMDGQTDKADISALCELYGFTALSSMLIVFDKAVISGHADKVKRYLYLIPLPNSEIMDKAISRSASCGNYKTLSVLLEFCKANPDKYANHKIDGLSSLMTGAAKHGYYKTLGCLADYAILTESVTRSDMVDLLIQEPLIAAIKHRQICSIKYIAKFYGALQKIQELNKTFDDQHNNGGTYALEYTDIDAVVVDLCEITSNRGRYTSKVLKLVVQYMLCRSEVWPDILMYAVKTDDLDLAMSVGGFRTMQSDIMKTCVTYDSQSVLKYVLSSLSSFTLDEAENSKLIIECMVLAVELGKTQSLVELIRAHIRHIQSQYGPILARNKYGTYVLRKNCITDPCTRYRSVLRKAIMHDRLLCVKTILRMTPQTQKGLIDLVTDISSNILRGLDFDLIVSELMTDSRLVFKATDNGGSGSEVDQRIVSDILNIAARNIHTVEPYIIYLLRKKYGICVKKSGYLYTVSAD